MAGATVPAPLLSVFEGFVSPPRRASLAEALVAWEGFVLGPKTLRIHSMMHVHLGQLCFPHPTHWDAHGHPPLHGHVIPRNAFQRRKAHGVNNRVCIMLNVLTLNFLVYSLINC